MLATAKTAYCCPDCKSDLSLDPALVGRKILCPKCKRVFRFSAVKKQPLVEPNLGSPNATPNEAQTRFKSWKMTTLAFLLGIFVTVSFTSKPRPELHREVVQNGKVSETVTPPAEPHTAKPEPISQLRVRDSTPTSPEVTSSEPDLPKKVTASNLETQLELPREIRKESAPPPTESRPTKLAADIIIVSVSVVSSKNNGAAWDASGGAPDIQVYVGHDYVFSGTSEWTSTKQDTYYATFNERTIRVKEGERIKIQVWDNDVLDDDLIGEYVKEITAESIRQGTVVWTFDQVLAITIKFEL